MAYDAGAPAFKQPPQSRRRKPAGQPAWPPARESLKPVPPQPIDYAAHPHVGAALQAERERQKLNLELVAEVTKVRRAYLAAVEAQDYARLPARPFVAGYVRAYAQALGQDPAKAAERLAQDWPSPDAPVLKAPVGVGRERDPRLKLLGGGVALVIGAILLWNVAQRAMDANGDAPAAVPEARHAVAAAKASAPSVRLGAPLPAPPEATTPAAYVTPGLADAAANGGSADAADAAAKAVLEGKAVAAPAPVAPTLPPPAHFQADGAVFGAPAAGAVVVLQAARPAALIVRRADGSIAFAKQLAKGEAWRTAGVAGLTADVSDPAAFHVYVAGAVRPALTGAVTPLSKLIG